MSSFFLVNPRSQMWLIKLLVMGATSRASWCKFYYICNTRWEDSLNDTSATCSLNPNIHSGGDGQMEKRNCLLRSLRTDTTGAKALYIKALTNLKRKGSEWPYCRGGIIGGRSRSSVADTTHFGGASPSCEVDCNTTRNVSKGRSLEGNSES